MDDNGLEIALKKADKDIEEAIIPYGVTEIQSCAFYGCRNLKLVRIPDSVTHIGAWAFSKCRSLRNVVIPSSVEIIDHNIFEMCTNLETIAYNGTKEQWDKISIDKHNKKLKQVEFLKKETFN